MNDPMEEMVRSALHGASVPFHEEGPETLNLDFLLSDHDIYIEVKQFHSDRISEQMSRAPNVIAIQGEGAARFFAMLLALLAQRIEHEPSKLGVEGSNPSERANA